MIYYYFYLKTHWKINQTSGQDHNAGSHWTLIPANWLWCEISWISQEFLYKLHLVANSHQTFHNTSPKVTGKIVTGKFSEIIFLMSLSTCIKNVLCIWKLWTILYRLAEWNNMQIFRSCGLELPWAAAGACQYIRMSFATGVHAGHPERWLDDRTNSSFYKLTFGTQVNKKRGVYRTDLCN